MRYVYICISGIVDGMMSSNFLTIIYLAMYIFKIEVGRIMVKSQGVLLLLGEHCENASTAKTLAMTHLDDPSFYLSFNVNIF